jgi:hypothetical protein
MKVKPQLSDELRRIPLVAKVLAVLVPLCVLAAITVFTSLTVTPAAPDQNGPGLQGPSLFMLVAILASGLLAIYVLLIGYVYADAARRNMSRWLWMLVVIFVPNALGFILYFLLRHPVPAECPDCGHSMDSDVAYCPHCGSKIGQFCPGCSRSVGLADSFCSGCGHDLRTPTEQTG